MSILGGIASYDFGATRHKMIGVSRKKSYEVMWGYVRKI